MKRLERLVLLLLSLSFLIVVPAIFLLALLLYLAG